MQKVGRKSSFLPTARKNLNKATNVFFTLLHISSFYSARLYLPFYNFLFDKYPY